MVVGHNVVRAALERELPPVALLLGPASVGKWTLARHLSVHHGYRPLDVLEVPRLDAESAREAVFFDLHFGTRRPSLAIVRLDGGAQRGWAAPGQVQNILLKTLEEPHAKFLLVADQAPLPTVVSRAHVYRLGLLTDAQVAEVLQSAYSLDEESARSAARTAGGQVATALEAQTQREAAAAVQRAVRAVQQRDSAALHRALRSWDLDAHLMLFRWAASCATGRWRPPLAEPEEGLTAEFGRKLLLALSKTGLARPRLSATIVLSDVLSWR